MKNIKETTMGIMISGNSATRILSIKVLEHSQSSTSVEPQTQEQSSMTCLKKRWEDKDGRFPENRGRQPFLCKIPMADGIYAIALAIPARRNTTELNKKEQDLIFLTISTKKIITCK